MRIELRAKRATDRADFRDQAAATGDFGAVEQRKAIFDSLEIRMIEAAIYEARAFTLRRRLAA